ncbi:MAG: hypothetical protein ACLRFM_00940 [Alphaproteobacteria bacterium]
MKTKIINEQLYIANLSGYSDQDLQDIKSLLIASLALIMISTEQKRRAKISSIMSHGTALLNGAFGINYAYHNDNKILLFLWFLPAILYFAKKGFDANELTRDYDTKLNDKIAQHNALKNTLESANKKQIHGIAKTFHDEIPDITKDTLNPDQTSKIIHHILMKYQR